MVPGRHPQGLGKNKPVQDDLFVDERATEIEGGVRLNLEANGTLNRDGEPIEGDLRYLDRYR